MICGQPVIYLLGFEKIMIFEKRKTKIQKLYEQFAGAVAYISVVDEENNDGIGSAFHIGDGIFITAKHVIENKRINEIATTKRIKLIQDEEKQPKVTLIDPSVLHIVDGPYQDEEDDVAVFKVDIDGIFLPAIQLGSHTSHEVSDNDFVLSNVIVIGYPPIPFTTTPNQVVATGQVNAVIDVWHSKYVHFVLSTMARGGFSGGVVLTNSGFALGIVTESLGKGDSQVETGYMSVLSIDSAIALSVKHFDFDLSTYKVYRDEECLVEIKMVSDELSRLNSRLHNACVYVLDNDRDVYIEFVCDDENLLEPAFEIFNSIVPLKKEKSTTRDKLLFGLPTTNPPAELLAEAAVAVKKYFQSSGYKELSTKRNTWQFRGQA